MNAKIDLTTALEKLKALAWTDGDLGAMYWNTVAELLIKAQSLEEQNAQLREKLWCSEKEIALLKKQIGVS